MPSDGGTVVPSLALVEEFEASIIQIENAQTMGESRIAITRYDAAREALMEALRGN